MLVMAVDWSGDRRSAHRRIWTATLGDEGPVELVTGRRPDEVVDAICALEAERLVVGFDFSFSVPRWYLEDLGCQCVDDLWQLAADEGERWLARCEPPLWGRPGTTAPRGVDLYRRCERDTALGWARPKSVFQIGGAGTVGTGSVRGWPHLRTLRAAGFAIWPFDPPAGRAAVEIYPRLFTGPVVKRDPGQRRRRLEELAAGPLGDRLTEPVLTRAVASEDAFDATVTALGMWEHRAALRSLHRATDPVELAEGAIWIPPVYRAPGRVMR